MSILSLPFTAKEMVKKVYHYTGNTLDEKNGLIIIASVSDEYRLLCRHELFNLQIQVEKTKKSIDDKCWNLQFDDTNVAKIKSYTEVVNRCSDYLSMHLKEMLRPVWNVYWQESCNGLQSIAIWLLKADEDGGEKVFTRLSESKK